MQKLQVPGFRRYIREDSDTSDIGCVSQDESQVLQTGEGIIADDYLPAPLTEDTLGMLGERPHSEVFPTYPFKKRR